MKDRILLFHFLILSLLGFSQTDTLTSHFPDYSDTLFNAGVEGYVSGHNYWQDQAKLQKFDTNYGIPSSGDYEVRAILFWIAAKEGLSSTSVSFAAIWEDGPNGVPPSPTPLANTTLLIDVDTSQAGRMHINGNAYYNAVATFQNPVPVPANRKFWAGIQLTSSNYFFHEYAWLKTTNVGSFPDTNAVLDQWSDGSFQNTNAWTFVREFAYAIFPVIAPRSAPGNDTTDVGITALSQPGPNAVVGDSLDLAFVFENAGNTVLDSGTQYQVKFNWGLSPEFSANLNLSKDLQPGMTESISISAFNAVPDTLGTFGFCAVINYPGDTRIVNDTLCGNLSISKPIGIASSQEEQFKIYPSPVKDRLFLDGVSEESTLDIHSIYGQKVLELNIKPADSQVLDLGLLAPGTYIVTINNATFNKAISFIKE